MYYCYQYIFYVLVLVLVFSVLSSGSKAASQPASETNSQVLNLPYAFYNESFGAAVGYVYGIGGFPQKQSSLIATVMAGSKGSVMGFLMGTDIRLPWNDRLFLDPIISTGFFSDADSFIGGNPAFPNQRPGDNNSDKDNFVSGDGWDHFLRLRFKYLLPIGSGKDQIIPNYVFEKGFLKSGATGGQSLNPLESGRSFAEIRPFYRSQQIDGDYVDGELKTNGLDFALFWDNRDFYLNPSYGNSLRLKLVRDFGLMDSSNSWTSIDGELDVYYPLGESELFRQRVLAFDFWTSYSPTWDIQPDDTIVGRPPAYSGATLGGLFRMKGYPAQRFSDKAAIYYSAEMRMTPRWNPFDYWQWFQKRVGVQWIQLTPFVEIGRVAGSWDISELHSDLKWCGGIAIRAMAKGLVVRIDTAASEEGVNVQMMINHPFQF